MNSLPAALKPCADGWTILPILEKFEILEEEEFSERYLRKTFIDSFLHLATSMDECARISGGRNDRMGRYFKLFPNSTFEKIVEYTNEELARQ